MKKIFRIVFLTFFSTSFLSATNHPSKEICINVFIHGIIRPVVNIGDMIKISRQEIKQSRYKHITRYVRLNNLSSRSQPMQEVGLQPIKMEPGLNNNGSRAIVAVFKKFKMHEQNKQFDHDNQDLFYTFGWSGLLSYTSRQKAAQFLYKKLIRLIDQLKKDGFSPKLRILAFSHGGNVTVQMANFDPWNKLKSKLTINEFIALGMPVQKENDALIRHPMFEKVYHFYSIGDIPQKLDFVSTDFSSSHRRYQARKCFTIPEKLTQIQIRFSKNSKIKRPAAYKKSRVTNYDPTHIEMWSFGWSPSGYNQKSPLYPLPAVAIAPYLINLVKNMPELGRNLIADINPNQASVTFSDLQWGNHHKIKDITVPFIPTQAYHEVKQAAWTRRPQDKTKLADKKIIKDAIYFATRQRKYHKHCSKILDCASKSCHNHCYHHIDEKVEGST